MSKRSKQNQKPASTSSRLMAIIGVLVVLSFLLSMCAPDVGAYSVAPGPAAIILQR